MTSGTPDLFVARWLKISGGLLVMLGCAVWIGRFTDQRWIVTISPSWPPMAFNTALGFILGGSAMFAAGANRVRAARSLAIAVAALGAGVLVLYFFADRLHLTAFSAFRYDPAAPGLGTGRGFDGRMAPNTAAGLAAWGVCLWLLRAERLRTRLVTPLLAAMLATAILAIISYVTGLRSAEAWWRYTAMAMHTAVGLTVASIALVFWLIRRVSETDRVLRRTLPISVGAGAAVLVLIAAALASNAQRLIVVEGVSRSLQIQTAIERFSGALARVEAAARGFALTGESAEKGRRDAARAEAQAAAEVLTALTVADPGQHERAALLAPLLVAELASSEILIATRQSGGVDDVARLRLPASPDTLAGLAALTAMQTEEARLLRERRERTAENERLLKILLRFGLAFTVGLTVAAFTFVRRAQRDLQQANEQLEERVRQRTAELEASTGQVRESERRLQFLADTMPQLVWTAGPNGAVQTLNRGYRDYLGVGTDAEGLRILDSVVHPDDQSLAAAEWGAMFAERRTGRGELRLRRFDGTYRWHLWRAHPERDEAGNIARWIGTSTDIHEQKQAEEKLEERVQNRTAELMTSEERFRNAFHFAGIGMSMVGLDGRWLRVNKSLCEILGYSEAELLEKTFQQITHPDDLAADLAHVDELVQGVGRFYQMEKRYFHCDGHIVWVRLTVSMVHDAEGRPSHFISQIEDITERKRLEESLASARDQALEASRLKSEFLATMSHEIRTPMNGVIGMTALLRDTPLNPAQAEYVRTIESSGESLLTIINDILDYSKIEAGRIELEVTTFDLRECVEDALDLFVARAVEKKIELICLVDSSVPSQVAGDATRLRQILVNLLGNALKFTSAGEVLVSVRAERCRAGDSDASGAEVSSAWPRVAAENRLQLVFEVKDTGIGIPPEGMDRLFKSFSQVDASTTRRFGGTGLGLAISKRLAELLGGSMHVESVPQKGSTFRFTVVVEARAHVWPAQGQSVADLRGRRALVVEDNAQARRALIAMAEGWGMYVSEADTRPAALARLAGGPAVDVVIIDHDLPGTDGEQMVADIRALPGSANQPVVLLISVGHTLAGGTLSVSKPVKANALREALMACLRSTTSVPVRPASAPPLHDATLGKRCPLRLLVAEDNPVNQRVATLLLQRLGYPATVAGNGAEALAALEAADYDAILMDVEMPELDGCEATRRIRAKTNSRTRPWIIALTAGAMQQDRERAFAAGMNDFLTKPVRGEALSTALARAFDGLHG